MTKRTDLRQRRYSLAAAFVLVLAGACRNSSAPPPALASIAVSPATATLAVGKTQALAVTGTWSDGSTSAITNASFQSSAPAVATVSDAGLVTAVAVGSATVTVKASGATATASVTVAQAASSGPLVVFDDQYGAGVTFNPFGGSSNPPAVDTTQHHAGTASLKIAVPASGYSGGAFAVAPGQDLSGYNAVTFWAMASAAKTFDKVGLGNDSNQTTYQTELLSLPLTTAWTQFVIPLPLASKLTASTGLFHYAIGSAQGAFTLWIDDIQYEKLPAGVLGAPAPAIANATVTKGVGDSFAVDGLALSFPVNGSAVAVVPAPAYFTFTSSNTAVATVSAAGKVTAVGVGTANITAALGSAAATGTLTVNVSAAGTPSAPPPAPTPAAANVISLFSDAYTNVTVDTFCATWSSGSVANAAVGGAHLKKYSSLVFAGVDFSSHVIDATAMTNIHVDVWTPDSTLFKIKLVDFGPNGVYGSGNTESELSFDAGTSPKVERGKWIGFDIPLSRFTGLASRSHLAQLILSASTATVFVTNVYFYKYIAPTSLPVFKGAYAAGVSFAPFNGSTNPPTVDTTQHHGPTASLKVVIPASGYTGGALVSSTSADLSPFDALTFWAMASATKTIDKVGIANDAGANPIYAAELAQVTITPNWTKFVVPLPLASKLTAVNGLFHYATGADASGVTVWFDDIQYETVGSATLGAPRPAFTSATLSQAAGTKFPITGTAVSWFVGGSANATTLTLGGSYFTFTSSDSTVASVSSTGQVSALKAGSTHITGALGATAATGDIALTVTGVAPTPPPLPVFTDHYATGVSFAPFGGSVNPPSVDSTVHHSGAASLKVVIPAAGNYTGGALVNNAPVDLSSYDSITFWAMATAAKSFDKVGFANDTQSTTYACEWLPVPLTTTWTKYIVPLPKPGNLTSISGLFHYATGGDASGVSVYFNDIQYEQVGSTVLGAPNPAIATETVHLAVGASRAVNGTSVSYFINGSATPTVMAVPGNTFTYASSDPTVASVDANGKITALKNGTTNVAASLGSVSAAGKTTVQVP